jgi:hypothetical protein
MSRRCVGYISKGMAAFTHYRVTNEEQQPIMEKDPPFSTGDFLQDVRNDMQIRVISLDQDTLVFDLIGVDTSVANSLRRILLSEVPTLAIETVYIQDNTSILQDEILSHRLGLIPIKADPRIFEEYVPGTDPTDLNTVVFKLDVNCTDQNTNGFTDSGLPIRTVYSSDLEWQPQGDQETTCPGQENLVARFIRLISSLMYQSQSQFVQYMMIFHWLSSKPVHIT